jgi:hypothetical protein
MAGTPRVIPLSILFVSVPARMAATVAMTIAVTATAPAAGAIDVANLFGLQIAHDISLPNAAFAGAFCRDSP